MKEFHQSKTAIHQVERLVDTYFAHMPRQKPNKNRLKNVRLVAHRGAHDKGRLIQENTIAAFERAKQLGCYGIEFDVHATKDNVLVINHDPTLKRVWGHHGSIDSLPFIELRDSIPKVPTLEEVIDLYGKRMHLFIEVKAPFIATQALADALTSLTPCVDYHLLSLDETLLPLLSSFPKEALLLVPGHNNVKQFCRLSLQQSYGGVLGHYLLLTNKYINELKQANQIAGVGFVDSRFSLYRELSRGIEFIFTNNVSVVAHQLRKLRGEHDAPDP